MVFKAVIIFACFLTVATATDDVEFRYEKDCALVGGLCLAEEDCPHEIPEDVKGLCPEQKPEGAVCCNNPFPTTCAEGAGQCSRNCPTTTRKLEHESECPTGQHCCVWLL